MKIVNRLCACLNEDPRAIFPAGMAPELADRLGGLAIAGHSGPQLQAACGNETFRDGYRRAPLKEWSFDGLTQLVSRGRAELGRLDQQIADMLATRAELGELLGASVDPGTDDAPAPNDGRPAGVAAALRDSSDQARESARGSDRATRRPPRSTTTTTPR